MYANRKLAGGNAPPPSPPPSLSSLPPPPSQTANQLKMLTSGTCRSLDLLSPSLSGRVLAFAELQTDMTDLTADLQSLGIPTLDHKAYVMKVFFPGVNDHPILNDPKVNPPAAAAATTTRKQLNI